VRHGRRLLQRYEADAPVVLKIPTADLFSADSDSVLLFCAFNSGAPRKQNGVPVRRGPDLFVPATEFTRTRGQVVEVAFRSLVALPPTTRVRGAAHEWTDLTVQD
jgi:hypothetical protein